MGDATLTDAAGSASPCAETVPSDGAPASTLAAGDQLAGRYRILRFIAAGGIGEVYEAADALLEDRVAIKVLRAALSSKPGVQARFADEIRLARRVTHPNVCRVFDVGIDTAGGPRAFYTMELHPGTTLATWRGERGAAVAPDEVAPLVRQLLAGVAAAHAVGVIHGDLKPSNVLLSGPDGGRAIVTDFGLALTTCASWGGDAGALLGTPAYMAPEQVRGEVVCEGTDVFAIGAILFELLTGELPWTGATALELAHARLHVPAPPPRARRADLDPRWDAAIQACLDRDLRARPPTVAALASALAL